MVVTSNNKYIPDFHPLKASKDNAWFLAFVEKKLIIRKSEKTINIPEFNELDSIITEDGATIYIGRYDGHDCYSISLKEIPVLPENLELVELKELTDLSGDAGLFQLAGTANQLLHWNSVNRYCGSCGQKTTDKLDERAKICPKCGNTIYPRISPATITAVFHGDNILLAHNRNFRDGLYSLIAGYAEPGETLEQCVEREIREEVGIKVKNIKYFSSQPWPFPDSLMLAFTAEYESGELIADGCEIMDAKWYRADSLPDIPSTDSIAGKMIRWFREK